MYTWYAHAEVYYAYLSDVSELAAIYDAGSEFARSRWFTRGWTLQELLAPSFLIIFSTDWIKIGEKSSMSIPLSTITGINEEILTGDGPLEIASVAKRMSWAARRTTTRTEDLAYCLMGIFSVNMPMLYGEGARAFIRLQEEIMKISDDETLSAWTNPEASPDPEHELFATSPAFFADSGSYVPYFDPRASVPYSMTNQGLRINLSIIHVEYSETLHVAALNCPSPDGAGSLAIYLKMVSAGGHYTRVKCAELTSFHTLNASEEEIRVRQIPSAVNSQNFYDIHGLMISKVPIVEHGYKMISVLRAEGSVSNRLVYSSRESEQQSLGDNPAFHPSFILPKTPRELASAFLFDSFEPERILISLGFWRHTQIGFSAISVPKTISTVGEAWTGRCIAFYPPGTPIQLEYHTVCVDVQTKPIKTQKHFFVDITIKAFQHDRPHFQIGTVRILPPENTNSEHESTA